MHASCIYIQERAKLKFFIENAPCNVSIFGFLPIHEQLDIPENLPWKYPESFCNYECIVHSVDLALAKMGL